MSNVSLSESSAIFYKNSPEDCHVLHIFSHKCRFFWEPHKFNYISSPKSPYRAQTLKSTGFVLGFFKRECSPALPMVQFFAGEFESTVHVCPKGGRDLEPLSRPAGCPPPQFSDLGFFPCNVCHAGVAGLIQCDNTRAIQLSLPGISQVSGAGYYPNGTKPKADF